MQRNLLFIVNPKAGKKASGGIPEVLAKVLKSEVSYETIIWSDKDNFENISGAILSGRYTDVIAVGGDGTVNRVATELLGTDLALGILPVGSGNGLARSLGLSMDLTKAVRQVVEGRNEKIDSGTLNGKHFFCTAGAGFDAEIGTKFARSVKRGLRSYIAIVIRSLLSHQSGNYCIILDGKEFRRKAFLVTVANAGQYGNDFYIAPEAKMKDGMFHVAVLRPFNFFTLWGILFRILQKKAHRSGHIETFRASKILIRRETGGAVHYDGEPGTEGTELVFDIRPGSLRVITGPGFKG
jgi:diacylglycerol kinase (ATP)